MLYENEYIGTRNKKEFTKLVMKRYSHLKESSVERRFYDCKKILGKQKETKYPDEEKKEPAHLKMIVFNDMKRFGKKTDRDILLKYGFNDYEVNWLDDKGEAV